MYLFIHGNGEGRNSQKARLPPGTSTLCASLRHAVRLSSDRCFITSARNTRSKLSDLKGKAEAGDSTRKIWPPNPFLWMTCLALSSMMGETSMPKYLLSLPLTRLALVRMLEIGRAHV